MSVWKSTWIGWLGVIAVLVVGCTTNADSADTPDDASGVTEGPDGPATTGSAGVEALALPARPGTPPDVTEGVPHIQLDQNSPDDVLVQLADWAFSLDGIVEQPSRVSLPGARALTLAEGVPINDSAMLRGREFAHIHPQPTGGSLHLTLSIADAQEVVDEGWGEFHPFALDGSFPNLVMVYAPRDAEDLAHVKSIVEASVGFATSGSA